MRNQRLSFCFAFIFVLLGALALRVAYIQIFKSVKYAEMAQKQYVKKVRSESYRGSILDRNGAILASTLESHSVFIRPKEFRRTPQSLQSLSHILSMDPSEIKQKLSTQKDFVWLERKLSPSRMEAISSNQIKGVGTVSEQKRYYPNATLACHLLGAVGMDNHGLAGIEQSLESLLKGRPLVLDQLRDGKGRRISGSDLQRSLASGNADAASDPSVTLTIDRSLQFIAEREIKQGVEENRAERGMVILQNPKTGEILAMASYPAFDPNQLAAGSAGSAKGAQIQNPMVSKLFEPGSTFKMVTFAAALEEKKIALSDLYDCESGKWSYGGVTINDHEPQQMLSTTEVMEKSSNIGTAKIALKLGKEALYQYARAFGFGTKSGLPLPGETEGLLRDPSRWSKVSLPILSFGQEIGVNAVQLCSAFSAIANRGVLLEPQIIKEVDEIRDGQVYKTKFETRKVRSAVSEATARTLCAILKSVVERGTGVQAKVAGYSVAGKTGTAQKIDPKTRKYSTSKYVSSFCGFVPAEDPQLVCLVILDEPKKDYWGSSTAAPIFSRIVSRSVNILGIAPQPAEPITLVKVR